MDKSNRSQKEAELEALREEQRRDSERLRAAVEAYADFNKTKNAGAEEPDTTPKTAEKSEAAKDRTFFKKPDWLKKKTDSSKPRKDVPTIVDALDEGLKKKGVPRERPTPEEERVLLATDSARRDYFDAKNAWVVDDAEVPAHERKIEAKKAEYQAAKNTAVLEYLAKGKKEEAQEFLLKEVELNRKNDLENGFTGEGEAIIASVSKAIEKWDSWGKEEGFKGYLQRLAKTGVSLAMIGVISGLSVEGLAKMGIGTASALGGGITSYLGKRIIIGTGISAMMAAVPDNKKKWVSAALVAGSAGLALAAGGGIAVAGLVVSSAIGLGLSKLLKKYDKKIEADIEEVKKGSIDINTLESDILKMEQEMETALREAEKARVFGKIRQGAVAIAGSIATLEVFGATQEYSSGRTEPKADTSPKPEPAQTPPAPEPRPAPVTSTATDTAPTPEPVPAPVTSTAETTPPKPEPAPATTDTVSPTPEPAPSTTIDAPKPEPVPEPAPVVKPVPVPETEAAPAFSKEAIVGKGEGIEHALRRQIEMNPQWAKDNLGFTGDVNDEKALHEFSGWKAHKIAVDAGYVDKVTGEEIRVSSADKVAYWLKVEKGEIKVDEVSVKDGNILETREKTSGFEGKEKTDSHEYKTPQQNEAADPKIIEKTPVTPEPTPAPVETKTPVPEPVPTRASEGSGSSSETRAQERVAVTPADTSAREAELKAEIERKIVFGNQTIKVGQTVTTGTEVTTGTTIGTGSNPTPSGNGERGTNIVYGPGGIVYGPKGEIIEHYFRDLSIEKNIELDKILDRHPVFAENSAGLTGQQVLKVVEASQKDVEFIFRDGSPHHRDLGRSVNEILKGEEANERLAGYLRVLKNFSTLEPYRGFLGIRGETVEHYMARALLSLERNGKLETFEASVRK